MNQEPEPMPPNPNYPTATSSGLPTGEVKVVRQNYTKARGYTPCACVRICKYCLADNPDVTPAQLLATIAKSMGFQSIALPQARTQNETAGQSGLVRALESVRDQLDRFLRLLGLDV